MLALSIRQPFAELILRGIKTAELRSRATRIIGERFWIYAARKRFPIADVRLPNGKARDPSFNRQSEIGNRKFDIWSNDLRGEAAPAWMIELARQVRMIPIDAELPTGVIVGSAVIESVSQHEDGMWRWELAGVERAKRLRKPTGRPQPVWFRAF